MAFMETNMGIATRWIYGFIISIVSTQGVHTILKLQYYGHFLVIQISINLKKFPCFTRSAQWPYKGKNRIPSNRNVKIEEPQIHWQEQEPWFRGLKEETNIKLWRYSSDLIVATHTCSRADYYSGGLLPNQISFVCLVLSPKGYTAYIHDKYHSIQY